MASNDVRPDTQKGSVDIEFQKLLNDLHSGHVEQFNAAVVKLRTIDDSLKQEAISEIKEFLSNPDPERRCDAIELLLLIDPPKTLDLILPLLNDPIDFVRNCVCQELEFNECYDKKVAEPLIDRLLNDTNNDVRYRAAVLLGKIGDDRAKPALIWVISNDKGVNYEGDPISARAAWALGELGS
jgi:HEAT repeat protein